MKKRTLFSILTLVLVAVFAFSLTACDKNVDTLELLQNEYGIVVDGGSFEEGSTLVSNEILAATEEAANVLAAIADQNYDKDGTEEGLMRCECFCGHVWTETIPITDEHTIDYDDWHIVEESKNGQYGKYRVYCKYCDYYEEYWYLGGFDFISFIDGKMINYQYTYGGKVSHDEY